LHELAISEAIVTEVCQHVGAAKVCRIVLEIGRLSAVMPDAVRFCFDLAAKGTAVEGASLEIIEILPKGRCRQCASVRLVADWQWATCVDCGSLDIDFEAGRELRIRSVEVS
jgi:hydrogenase nickel incorporation protein HypA/HybF